MMPRYDYIHWTSHLIREEDVIDVNFPNEDFILEITKNELPLHFYISNFLENKSSCFLVGFSGAMANRNANTYPPFFSFRNTSNSINMPLLSVSDPTMSLNDSLQLGWYAGNNKNVHLQKEIAKVIDHIARKYDKTPILCGGSGGGFASLAISSLLTVENYAFVWNPQTDITKYYKRFVLSYINTAYPENTGNKIRNFMKFCQKREVIFNLSDMVLSTKTKAIFLQNKSDSHAETHAMPFLKKQCFELISDDFFKKNQYHVVFDNWGEGHVAPSLKAINYILTEINNRTSILDIIVDIRNRFESREF